MLSGDLSVNSPYASGVTVEWLPPFARTLAVADWTLMLHRRQTIDNVRYGSNRCVGFFNVLF